MIAVALLLVASFAAAETKQVDDPKYDMSMFNSFLNNDHSYTDRYNDMEEREWPMGAGLNLVVWEFENATKDWGFDSISVEQRYDFPNKEYSVFGMLNVNLFRTVKNMFR